MNHFGQIFHISIFGESHGKGVGIVIDGVPPGIPLSIDDFIDDMNRRKGGTQKATTPRKEDDMPIFLSGLYQSYTTGAPLTLLFENNNIRSSDYEKIQHIPRPGHADWVAHQKYNGFEDGRGGGHFSGRLTACIVAVGVVAKKLIPHIHVQASLLMVGGEQDIEKGIQKAIDKKDSVGGIIQCMATPMPIGLGEPFFNSVESYISHLAFSIPAIKGIEFGAGFAAASMFGKDHNDPIINDQGTTATNHAGGIVGGISNGNDLIFRVVVKPTSSTPQMQESWNITTHALEKFQVKGRHDLCIALRVPVVIEAITAMALADLLMVYQSKKIKNDSLF